MKNSPVVGMTSRDDEVIRATGEFDKQLEQASEELEKDLETLLPVGPDPGGIRDGELESWELGS
jgi:hypothetical protein